MPPFGKGSLYIRPLLMGSGAVLGLAPAPEYTFLVYVSPVGNYFKVCHLCSFLTMKYSSNCIIHGQWPLIESLFQLISSICIRRFV